MPDIYIYQKTGTRNPMKDRPNGLILSIPDQVGTFLTNWGEITIESIDLRNRRVVLSSSIFKGHQRNPEMADPYFGSETREIQLNNTGGGSKDLSFFETLNVQLRTQVLN